MKKETKTISPTNNFVQSMLQSAQDNREVKPQTRHDFVNQEEVDRVMANLKKGMIRR